MQGAILAKRSTGGLESIVIVKDRPARTHMDISMR